MQYFFLVVGLITVIIFNCIRKPAVSLNMVILKGSASLCFIFTALFSFVANVDCPGYVGALTVVGACFGLIGDIVLDLKYVYKKDSDRYLKTGFSSFLIGHVFYTASIIYGYGFKLYPILFGVLCFICGIIFALFAEKLLKLKYRKFKLITVLYTAVINTTFGLAFAYMVSEPSTHTIIFTVGMFLFFVSDGILSRTYFSINEKDRNSRVAVVLNHTSYFIAQYLIATSLIFFRG